MADLEEAEQQAGEHVGFENHLYGRILARLIRQVRLITNRLPLINDRFRALEDRVKALEDAAP